MTWSDAINIIVPIACLFGGYFFDRLINKKDRKKDKSHSENDRLKAENASLKEQLSLYEDVEQSTTGNYLIMKGNGWKICPTCWTKDRKPVLIYDNGGGTFVCGGCGKAGTYDHQKVRERDRRIEEHNRQTAEYFSF